MTKVTVNLDYDVATGHPLIWVAEIVSAEGRRLWPSAFPSLGDAQVFFSPQLDGPSWQKRDDGWVGEIRQQHQAAMQGHTVLIHNLLLLKQLSQPVPLDVHGVEPKPKQT